MTISPVKPILRNATRAKNEPLNILTFPTHERYQSSLAETGQNFYLFQKYEENEYARHIKPWNDAYCPVPKNTTLLNPDKKENQIPEYIDIDLILSQNKFGQFQIAKQLSEFLNVPLLSIEHTLPRSDWGQRQIQQTREMVGDINVFISEFSRRQWGWNENEAAVIHHGIDTSIFKPIDGVERENVVLSVVNDWINRDWCCGFSIWKEITGFPKSNMPLSVVGDTPGLSEPASSIEELVYQYSRSSVFLNTSTVSPVPTAMLEAMSCGCAVVTTATCMIPEIIVNGENGFISNDQNELRSCVNRLLEDRKLAAKIGENARKTILEHFGLSSFIENWNQLFYGAIA